MPKEYGIYTARTDKKNKEIEKIRWVTMAKKT
jgi:hypothetical protein